jgi:hypothetical protein
MFWALRIGAVRSHAGVGARSTSSSISTPASACPEGYPPDANACSRHALVPPVALERLPSSTTFGHASCSPFRV